ncbi:MAG: ACT domain-containing protein [Algibacter sp.]|uniref:ACT domain-containing protein n=1 Tax=Algibacter sp. TaxID=1872428 RepID=UPI00329729A9
MTGEKNLEKLVRSMNPKLNQGNYVFVTVKDFGEIKREDTICEFKEAEGITLVMSKLKADALDLKYDFVARWITLEVHSALDAVGLTALFAEVLTKHNISCNVIAGFYHDHIFVDKNDAEQAVKVLTELSENY